MKTKLKRARREVKNPLYGRDTPKALLGTSREIKKLWSQKEMRIPVSAGEILPLQEKLRPVLKLAWPSGSEKDISWLTADLAGLWEVSRVHIMLVKKLLKTGDKFNSDKLKQISIDLDINWFVNASGHMQTLKHELVRFRASLYKSHHASREKGKGRVATALKRV